MLRPATLEVIREWPTDLRGAKLVGAKLQKADFAGALVENTIFDHADVTQASFSEVALAACSFADAQGFTTPGATAAQ